MKDLELSESDVVQGHGRPEPPDVGALTPQQAQDGRHLEAIHRLYLRDLSQIEVLMEDIRAGRADPATLAPAIRGMPMARNLRIFGTACDQACQALTIHHMIEDRSLFPQIAAQAQDHRPVIERLLAEHEVLAEGIEALAVAAEWLAREGDNSDGAGFDTCAERFAAVMAMVRSHFRYEETRLAPVMGKLGIQG